MGEASLSRRGHGAPAAAPRFGTDSSQRRNEVGSLRRGLLVLEALANAADGASPQQLIDETGLDRSVVQRLLRTLVADGYASRLGRGHYVLATRALALGAELARSNHLARVASAHLLDLQQQIGETVNLATLDGVDVVYVARFATRRLLSIHLDIGTRLPAYCTSLGRAILAYLPPEQTELILRRSECRKLTEYTKVTKRELLDEINAVAERGYALTSEELELGMRSAAAPVFASGGVVLGAINVSVPTARVDAASLEKDLVPPLLDVTRSLSLALGS
jgi:IclR family pca regulon transcriptional regulator